MDGSLTQTSLFFRPDNQNASSPSLPSFSSSAAPCGGSASLPRRGALIVVQESSIGVVVRRRKAYRQRYPAKYEEVLVMGPAVSRRRPMFVREKIMVNHPQEDKHGTPPHQCTNTMSIWPWDPIWGIAIPIFERHSSCWCNQTTTRPAQLASYARRFCTRRLPCMSRINPPF